MPALTLDDRPILVRGERCKRVRFRKNTCRACVRVCPTGAVSLGPAPTINAACNGCGLCASACPTEAFVETFGQEDLLLSRIASLQCENQSANRGAALLIRCERGTAGENSPTISCLGTVSENVILAAALTGWTSLVFVKGDCSHCPLRKGEGLLQKAIDCSRSLLDVLGFREFRVHVRQVERNRPASLPRRALFRKITERLNPTETRSHGKPKGSHEARQTPRRTALLNLLRQAPGSSEAVLRSDPSSPFAQIVIHSERCSACGLCGSVCPTGALTITSGDGYSRFEFNSGLCLNCSLCGEACPVPGALEWKGTVSLATVAEAKFANAARIELEACLWCGELVRSGEGAVCPICRKRHLLEAESVLAAPPDTETTTVA